MRKLLRAVVVCLAVLALFCVNAAQGASDTPYSADKVRFYPNSENEEWVYMSQGPLCAGDEEFYPLRAVAEALGATVDWDGAAKSARVAKEGVDLFVALGKTDATLNGEKYAVDPPPFLVGGQTFIPKKVIEGAFDLILMESYAEDRLCYMAIVDKTALEAISGVFPGIDWKLSNISADYLSGEYGGELFCLARINMGFSSRIVIYKKGNVGYVKMETYNFMEQSYSAEQRALSVDEYKMFANFARTNKVDELDDRDKYLVTDCDTYRYLHLSKNDRAAFRVYAPEFADNGLYQQTVAQFNALTKGPWE